MVGIAGGVIGIAYLMVSRGVVMAQSLLTSLGPEGSARGFIDHIGGRLGPLHISLGDLTNRLRDAAADLASRAALAAGVIAQAAMGGLLGLFFAVLTIYFVLRNWPVIERLAELMLPLDERHSHALLEEFRVVGRTTLLGTVLAGLLQGLLAAIDYWVAGIHEPAFFGALTAVASLVPAVGTLLVWIPAGLYLLATDHVAAAVFELVFGALIVVGFTDYIVRPRLVGGEGNLPVLLTFVALFGGVEVFGLVGLMLGPLLISMAVALLRIYAKPRARCVPRIPIAQATAVRPKGREGPRTPFGRTARCMLDSECVGSARCDSSCPFVR